MSLSRTLLWSITAAALIISAAILWSRLPSDPMAATVDVPLLDGQVYCCADAGTCLAMKKDDCSTFFLPDRKSCEARCGSGQ